MDIVEFLRARLDEGEREARVCLDRWIDGHGSRHRWDRQLREVEAKRAILAEVEARDDFNPQMWGMAQLPTRTLLALAATYADHPDHDPEWR